MDFAQARYYNSSHGRFTSVDPLTASANVKDPQTFNRYTYAMNSPYKFTDPLGLISSSTNASGNASGSCCTDEQLIQVIKEHYGGTWTDQNGRPIQMTEAALGEIIKKVLPELRKQADMSYSAQWNLNDQANNGGVSAQSTSTTTNSNTETTNPTNVTISGEGSVTLGGGVEGGTSGWICKT